MIKHECKILYTYTQNKYVCLSLQSFYARYRAASWGVEKYG